MKRQILFSPFLFVTALISSCSHSSASPEEEAQLVADSFATHYFTWHFKEAMKFADEDMKRYLTFMASNVHQSDLDILLSTEKTPEYEVVEVTMDDDFTARVKMTLRDVILMDTLGESAHMYPFATRCLTIKKDDGAWKVNSVKTK